MREARAASYAARAGLQVLPADSLQDLPHRPAARCLGLERPDPMPLFLREAVEHIEGPRLLGGLPGLHDARLHDPSPDILTVLGADHAHGPAAHAEPPKEMSACSAAKSGVDGTRV